MEKEARSRLKEAYKNRRPEMGVVCWKCGDQLWIAKSRDTRADYNGSSFQLKLGTWPNKDLQKAYSAAPERFEWLLLKRLEMTEPDDDPSEELELLYQLCREEYPQAQPMRAGRR